MIPSLEVGLRHDGGNAETSSGVERVRAQPVVWTPSLATDWLP